MLALAGVSTAFTATGIRTAVTGLRASRMNMATYATFKTTKVRTPFPDQPSSQQSPFMEPWNP